MYLRKCRKKGTDHPKVPVVWVTILVFEHFWVVSPFFTPVSLFIRYPAKQLCSNIQSPFQDDGEGPLLQDDFP